MDELLEAFLVECRELVEQAGRDLAALAKAPGDAGVLDSAFRAFHTLKGSAGMLEFTPLEAMLHAGEDVLSSARAGRLALVAEVLRPLTAALDRTDAWLDAIEASGALPPDAAATSERLQADLRILAEGGQTAPDRETAPASPWAEALVAAWTEASARTAFRFTPDPDCYFRGEDPLALVQAVPGLLQLRLRPREPWGAAELYDPFRCNLILEGLSGAPVGEVRTALRLAGDQAEVAEITVAAAPQTAPEPAAAAPTTPRTLRVDSGRIDALASAVDELVIAKNSLGQMLQDGVVSPRALADAQARLDRLVANLHADVMRMRLVPLAPVFSRFPRVVRETAASLGKTVELEVRGEDVEVDKAVVDALYEPLLHVVRNALDHGLETSEARRAAGKAATGRIRLDAVSAGQEVVITVSDDGRGIDAEAIRRTAVSKGLRTPAEAARLTDEQALDLIFAPGFSTASSVGALSGRGVGMDAVRTAAGALGGQARVTSRPGQGTTVQLILPATVVLTRLMVVIAGGERFGIPLDAIVETARVPRDRVTEIRAGRAFVLRGRPTPLLDLSGLLSIPACDTAGDHKVVVVRSGDDLIGIVVEAFSERLEAPLRPTTGLLAGMPGVLGTTLTGDGGVLMVLDVPELVG